MSEIKETTVEEVKEIPVEELAEEVKKPYTLRKLQDSDLFPLLQLLRKLGFKNFKDSYEKTKERLKNEPKEYASLEEKQEAVGVEFAFDMADFFVSKLDTHKDDLYAFYSEMSGIPAEEIKKMEFGTLPLMIYDSFSEVKNTAFFKVLTKLL